MDTIWFARVGVIAAAGAAGAVARWLLGLAAQSLWPQPDGALAPLSVLAPNLVGCFLFGALYGALHNRLHGDSLIVAAAFTGFLGAFTTFSTFAFELTETARVRSPLAAAIGATLHVGLGVLAVAAGLWLTSSVRN